MQSSLEQYNPNETNLTSRKTLPDLIFNESIIPIVTKTT